MEHVLMECGCVATGVDGATGAPVCVSHVLLHPGAVIPVKSKPDLTGRFAICSYAHKRDGTKHTVEDTKPSSFDLPFFTYEGSGSPRAVETCKHCGYFHTAHTVEGMSRNVPSNRRTVVELGKCPGFEAHGAYEFDSYYCGCWGWD